MATQTMVSTQVAPTTGESETQIRVQFTTNVPDLQLSNDPGPILVPTNLRRYGLSTLVNHLLGTERPTPFDFLISGSLLRTSIDDYLTANGLSSETALTLEYVRSIVPPSYLASFEHDDWVSSIDLFSRSSPAALWAAEDSVPIAGQERVLSASYDGLLRVWNMSSQVLATSPSAIDGGHSSGIKCAKFLSPSRLVSSGLDRTVRVWDYNESQDQLSTEIKPSLELYGHRASVGDICVHRPSKRILSASADHTVGVWSTDATNAPAAPEALLSSKPGSRAKRRKVSATTPQRGPVVLLKAHSAPVSAVTFASSDSTVAHSTSWDHTLRTWDLPTATLVDTRTTSHALLSVLPLSQLHLIATGTSARHITLIDPRVSATTVSAMTLRGHSNAVVSLACDPDSGYRLVSGSHDGQCRIWDVRATKTGRAPAHDGMGVPEGAVGESVYTIERESMKGRGKKVGGDGIKVFSVVWDKDVGIVSGGEDKRVQINMGQSMGRNEEKG
ncbi:MAG: ribosome biogenesis protein ytm1 [Peltula sp. TS41687]|nr:MAG: ribosome biogenesis protein ytm1 [Peltula sp. TS41687]